MEYRIIPEENFYLKEIKNTCNLLKEKSLNFSDYNLREILKEYDCLEATSANNYTKKYKAISKRICALTPKLQILIITSNLQTSKFINLYSILCVERFIAEFMEQVILEKYQTFNFVLYEKDFSNYLLHKSEQSAKVNSWSEASKKKMLLKIKNFLTEGGYLEKQKDNTFKITKPLVSQEVITEIEENGNNNILKIMLY